MDVRAYVYTFFFFSLRFFVDLFGCFRALSVLFDARCEYIYLIWLRSWGGLTFFCYVFLAFGGERGRIG